jgi:hypothetical protein
MTRLQDANVQFGAGRAVVHAGVGRTWLDLVRCAAAHVSGAAPSAREPIAPQSVRRRSWQQSPPI